MLLHRCRSSDRCPCWADAPAEVHGIPGPPAVGDTLPPAPAAVSCTVCLHSVVVSVTWQWLGGDEPSLHPPEASRLLLEVARGLTRWPGGVGNLTLAALVLWGSLQRPGRWAAGSSGAGLASHTPPAPGDPLWGPGAAGGPHTGFHGPAKGTWADQGSGGARGALALPSCPHDRHVPWVTSSTHCQGPRIPP